MVWNSVSCSLQYQERGEEDIAAGVISMENEGNGISPAEPGVHQSISLPHIATKSSLPTWFFTTLCIRCTSSTTYGQQNVSYSSTDTVSRSDRRLLHKPSNTARSARCVS